MNTRVIREILIQDFRYNSNFFVISPSLLIVISNSSLISKNFDNTFHSVVYALTIKMRFITQVHDIVL